MNRFLTIFAVLAGIGFLFSVTNSEYIEAQAQTQFEETPTLEIGNTSLDEQRDINAAVIQAMEGDPVLGNLLDPSLGGSQAHVIDDCRALIAGCPSTDLQIGE